MVSARKLAALLAVSSLCLLAAACGASPSGSPVASAPSADPLQSIVNTLASPQAAAAANNVKTTVAALSCGLSAAAAAAEGVETQTYNGAPLVDATGQEITGVVYAASAANCALLGGTVTSPTPVAVPATAVVTPPAAAAS